MLQDKMRVGQFIYSLMHSTSILIIHNHHLLVLKVFQSQQRIDWRLGNVMLCNSVSYSNQYCFARSSLFQSPFSPGWSGYQVGAYFWSAYELLKLRALRCVPQDNTYTSFNVWVRCVMWNFKGYPTQSILNMICIQLWKSISSWITELICFSETPPGE